MVWDAVPVTHRHFLPILSATHMSKFFRRVILVCIFLGLTGCAIYDLPLPALDIVSVNQWGGTPANGARARLHTINRITLHHQGESFPPDKDPQKYLRDLQTWSRNTKGWLDIPYHYVIDLDGLVYEARDIRYAGDTNTGYDPAGHALIEVVGNFEEVEPNAAQLAAVIDLMAKLALRYRVPVEAISGHRDVASGTVCPGKNLYRYFENGYFRDQVANRLKR